MQMHPEPKKLPKTSYNLLGRILQTTLDSKYTIRNIHITVNEINAK